MTLRANLWFTLLLVCLGTSRLTAQDARPDSANQATSAVDQGFVYLESGALDSAEQTFKQALQRDDQNPRIYDGLGLVYYRRGRSRFYPLEAIKKLLKADNSSKAIRNFRKALELAPDFDEARYHLGLAQLARNKEDGFLEAREEFTYLAEKDSTYKDVFYRLGQAEFGLKQLERAAASYRRALRLYPEDYRAQVALAEIYLATGELKRASRMYFDGIAKLRDAEMLADLYDEIRHLCTPEEARAYEELPVDKKGLFFRRFWSKRDPTPTTIENERFAEHFRRVQYARSQYGIPFPPYYDDRGKIYIKYGVPDAVYRGTMYDSNVKNNESWSYESIHKGLIFDFVDYGGVYREVSDLTEAAPPGVGYERQLILASRLYAERTELGGTYTRVGMRFDQGQLMEIAGLKADALRAAPAEVYRHNYKARPLSFFFDLAQFRGQGGRTRTELYYGLRGKDLKFVQKGTGLTSTLEYDFVVKDSNYEELSRRGWTTLVQISGGADVRTQMPIHQGDFEVPPGRYQLAVQVRNPESNALGIYKLPIQVRRFSGDSLQVSDLQFSYEVTKARRQDRFVKHDLRVVPYPFSRVDRARPIFVYFEVYNLAFDDAGQTAYVVEYEVTVVQQKRSFLGKTLGSIGRLFAKGGKKSVKARVDRTGTRATAIEYISLDLSHLPAGTSQLTILILDQHSGDTARTSRTFQLVG